MALFGYKANKVVFRSLFESVYKCNKQVRVYDALVDHCFGK